MFLLWVDICFDYRQLRCKHVWPTIWFSIYFLINIVNKWYQQVPGSWPAIWLEYLVQQMTVWRSLIQTQQMPFKFWEKNRGPRQDQELFLELRGGTKSLSRHLRVIRAVGNVGEDRCWNVESMQKGWMKTAKDRWGNNSKLACADSRLLQTQTTKWSFFKY